MVPPPVHDLLAELRYCPQFRLCDTTTAARANRGLMRALWEQRHTSPAKELLVGVLLLLGYMVVIAFLSWLLVEPLPPEPVEPSVEPISDLVA